MKATIKAKSPGGFEMIFETPELKDRVVLLEALNRFEVELLESGYEPINSQPVAVSFQQAAPAGSKAPAALEEKFFLTSQLVPEILENSDEPYWRVKGKDGKFPKFAVRVWPEVLEEIGINVAEIPVKKQPLEGYRAYFEVNEAGNPKKVVKLEKVN